MKDELSEQQVRQILEYFDETLEKGPWDKSNFLREIGKKLRQLREEFASQLDFSQEQQGKNNRLANRIALHSGQQEVFVSLYSSDGNNLQAWERILSNLPKQMISRPIYAEESDVKEMISAKEKKANEAYVSIYINKSDILPVPADKTPMDKLGKPLLTLKSKSIHLENINRFAHQSGTYRFHQGGLTKISSDTQI